MTRISLLALALTLGCVSAPHSAPPNMPNGVPEPEPEAEPVAVAIESPQTAPTQDALCAPVTDCQIIARHPLDSPYARSRGFYESRSGHVASRHPNWRAHGRPEDTFVIEVSESCWIATGYYIESEGQIWLPSRGAGGAPMEPIEAQHDARLFHPLGHGIYDDGTNVFVGREPLNDIDRATFRVCEPDLEALSAWRFYPSAEDARGEFADEDEGLVRVEPADVDTAPATPDESREVVPCEPVTDCRIVARHRLSSTFARELGFYASRSGLVASRYSNWGRGGHPDDTFFIEVTESCWSATGYYIESEGRIWLAYPQSCGPETCAGSTGYYFAPIEARHRARSFRPLGHGFYDDGTHIFERGELVEEADRATFHACTAVPEDPTVSTFYPAAEDSRGLFGWGDCGDLGRASR